MVLVALTMGLLFGFAFARSRVFEPHAIRAQFLFKSFVMLKVFLGAMGTSALMLCIFSKLVPSKFEAARKEWVDLIDGPAIAAVCVGGTLLGTGMAAAGACPGMVLSQVGAGVPHSGITLAGGLTGALVFGVVRPSLDGTIRRGPMGLGKALFLDDTTRLQGKYSLLCLALAVGCLAAAGLLE